MTKTLRRGSPNFSRPAGLLFVVAVALAATIYSPAAAADPGVNPPTRTPVTLTDDPTPWGARTDDPGPAVAEGTGMPALGSVPNNGTGAPVGGTASADLPLAATVLAPNQALVVAELWTAIASLELL